jgi:hypothetical protein
MQKALWLVVGGSVIAGAIVLGIVGVASAQTMRPMMPGDHIPGVVGTVSAISGDTLTVTSKSFGDFGRDEDATSSRPTSTTYVVDATNATVMKNGTSSTLSAVALGDMIFVQGTVSGTNVTATAIRDGNPLMGPMGPRGFGPGPKRGPWNASGTKPMPTALIQGNGEPVVGGTVTTSSGSALTVTTAKDNIVYTIDASNATIVKGGATSTIANIAIGDNVLVQGSISGTSVTATSILDQGAPRTATSTGKSGEGDSGPRGLGGFFGAIGNIFHRFFGFF